MLLVITLQRDSTIESVVSLVKKPVVRLDFDQNPCLDMSYGWDGKRFRHEFCGINLDEVTSVWFRLTTVWYWKKDNNPYHLFNRLSREEMTVHLYGLLERAFWVSQPAAIRRAENKMLQLETAQSLGMTIPLTLVTSSVLEVQRFRSEVGDIVVKPMAKVPIEVGEKIHAIYTNRIPPKMEVNFDLLSQSPAIFQQEIERICDIRTIVVGEKVFSLGIRQVGAKTGGVDYRIGASRDLQFESVKLPDELEQKCVRFVRGFGLSFSAMDFILGEDGEYYFLENNPCGAWKFVENGGGYDISGELARILS